MRREKAMSTEVNKAAIRTYFEEFWNQGNIAAADDFNQPDCVVHFPDSVINGVSEVKGFGTMFQDAFSDINVVIDDLVAEGDLLAGRWSCSCKHTAEFMGVAATGKLVKFTGFFTMRLVDGKRAESWEFMDNAGLMKQLTA
jgi:predicted ester cyclase